MLSIAIAIVATILLAGAFPRLRETTLRLPWAWTVLALIVTRISTVAKARRIMGGDALQ